MGTVLGKSERLNIERCGPASVSVFHRIQYDDKEIHEEDLSSLEVEHALPKLLESAGSHLVHSHTSALTLLERAERRPDASRRRAKTPLPLAS